MVIKQTTIAVGLNSAVGKGTRGAELCCPFLSWSFLKTPTSKIVGRSEGLHILEKEWDKYWSERAGASKVSAARRQPGGCRVLNNKAKASKLSVTPFPKKSPENHLVLLEGSCGKVAHDLKLTGDSLTSVYLFLEANRRVESAMALQVQVLSASSHVELHPRRRLVQEDVRRCRNPPWLSRFGFERDLHSSGWQHALPAAPATNLHWCVQDPVRLDHLTVTSVAFSCACPPTRQIFFIFMLKAEQFLWEQLSAIVSCQWKKWH